VYLLVTHDVRLSVGKHRLHVDTTHDISLNVQLGFFSLTVARHCPDTQSASYTASNAAVTLHLLEHIIAAATKYRLCLYNLRASNHEHYVKQKYDC